MCHCKDAHGELHIKGGGFDAVKYLDVSCNETDVQYTRWEAVPPHSIHTLYGMHCPIYDIFLNIAERGANTAEQDQVVASFNEGGWNCLISGGRLILPYKAIDDAEKVRALRSIRREMPRWKVSYQKEIGFEIEEEAAYERSYLVLQKHTARRYSTRRLARRRRHTRRVDMKN